jgi:hypothetical protein
LTSISIPIHLPYIGRQLEPERVPLSSLDTLYSQAQLLNPVLLAMTRSYAANFNGVFPTKQSKSSLDNWEFRAWPLGSSDLKARNFILGGVKSVARCVAKKDMAYRGDASRLLDICRQVKTMKWIPYHPFPLLVSCHSPSSLLHFPHHRDWARHSRHWIHPSTSYSEHWFVYLTASTCSLNSKTRDESMQSIYFKSIRDLLACLTALSNDPNVTIVRIKSYLTEGLDSDPLFSGKRFVNVNLQLQNDITRQLCVDNHIAELLLIPIAVHSHSFNIGLGSCNHNGLMTYYLQKLLIFNELTIVFFLHEGSDFSPSLPVSVSLSLSLSPSLPPSLRLSVSLSLSPSLPLSLPLSLPPYVSVSFSLSIYPQHFATFHFH